MSKPESELTPEELQIPRSVGVRPGKRKPISLWATQALFALQAWIFGVVGFRALLGHPVKALFGIGIGIGISAGLVILVLAIQRRRPWAHVVTSALLMVLCVVAIANQFREGPSRGLAIRREERSGSAVGAFLCA